MQTRAVILGSTALVGAAAILGLGSAWVWERRRWHPLGLTGIVCATVALGSGLTLLWGEYLGSLWFGAHRWFWRSALSAWIVAITLPLVGILGLARLHRRFEWILRWTIIVNVVLSGLIIWLIFGTMHEQFLFRLMGILAILGVCGILAVPIFHRISAIRLHSEISLEKLQLSLTCPRCTKVQVLPVGRSHCTACGLAFSIEIMENVCRQCGYSLYKLESAQCPECGTLIAPIAEHTSIAAVET